VARFRLRVLNSRQVSADLLDTAAHIGRAGDRASREIGRAGEQALRSAAPSRTGHLRRGIGTSEETRAGRQVIVVHGNAALRFVIGGRVLYRRWVRAYHPSHDWVEDADPAIDSAIEAATARLARGL
jgi:hypothetical protein